MSFKREDGKKRRARGQQPRRWLRRSKASAQEPDDVSTNAPGDESEESLETSPESNLDEFAVALSNSLLQFAADHNSNSSVEAEPDPDGSTRFQIVDEPSSTYESVPLSETPETTLELVDSSRWFEYDGANSLDEDVEEQHQPLSEEPSSDFNCANIQEVASDDAIAIDVGSSATGNSDEVSEQVFVSSTDQTMEPAHDERRKHPREDSSDLVWVEYYNPSMECTGREAARVENFGGGGMRVATKTASASELERVIVRYPYRGFESCSIVRSRYQGTSGQEHLCLEFTDRDWRVNATRATVQNSSDEIRRGKILLADDDSAFRKILGNILIKAGYDVVLAEDGESAVEKATKETPDLVITDGLMPKLHGFQVCQAVKRLVPQPIVIMLTAVYTTPHYVSEVKFKFGADEVITKPCQIADLLSKIDGHLHASCQVPDALIAVQC